jgi:hypothetical protein
MLSFQTRDIGWNWAGGDFNGQVIPSLFENDFAILQNLPVIFPMVEPIWRFHSRRNDNSGVVNMDMLAITRHAAQKIQILPAKPEKYSTALRRARIILMGWTNACLAEQAWLDQLRMGTENPWLRDIPALKKQNQVLDGVYFLLPTPFVYQPLLLQAPFLPFHHQND